MEGARGPRAVAIFCALATGPRSVTDICEELDTYQSQVSGHLAVLRRTGLVSAARRGYFKFYRVDAQSLDLIVDRLSELASQSSP